MNAWMKSILVTSILCLIACMASVVAGNEEIAGILGFSSLGFTAVGLIYFVVTA